MISLILKERIVDTKDWIAILFLLCFIFIAIAKNTFTNRFIDYCNLLFSDKYLRIYKDSNNIKSWFTIVLFVIQLISFSLFIHYLVYYFFGNSKSDWITFIQIFTLLTFFILSKFLIEKIIAELFDINDLIDQFNLVKINYRSYLSLIILPLLLIIYYNEDVESIIIYAFLIFVLFSNVLIYLNGIKIFQKIIFDHLFYFILYLCTLEIAPYYFMYYFFNTK